MYIRIINKNRIANNNTFEDFKSYPLDEGCVYINNYNEELDSMQCRVSNVIQELRIEPLDKVVIYDNNDNILNVMLVSSWESTMNGYVGDATYTYDLQLCSLTKQLENVILPDLSITPHREGTKLSIYDYIVRYVRLYYPKTRSGVSTTRTIQLDSTLATKFPNDAPELQWNKPTLREVLTSLMMVNDCIPVIKWQNNREELSFIDLTEKKNAITTYNYIQKSQSADNYVSELRMDMQNVLQTKVDEVNNTITTSEYIPFRSNNFLVTSDNILLETQFPILRIKHLWLFNRYYEHGTEGATSDRGITYKTDLCNLKIKGTQDTGGSLVYESKEYDSLNVLYRATNVTDNSSRIDNYYSKHQNYCVFYKRGSNTIEGFSRITKQPAGTLEGSQPTINWLKILGYKDAVGGISQLNFIERLCTYTNAHLNSYFLIEYETQYDQVFQASKEGKQHHRVIADNQTNSWVDATTQGNLEYQKANRLGNEIMLINQRVSSLQNAINCADYLDDSIVYKTEYQIYSNHIDVNAYATKNYILQDYWTGINSKIRTWRNAQEEAFRRQDLRKFYCEFDYDEKDDKLVNFENLSEYLVSPFDEEIHNEPIKYVAIYTDFGNSEVPYEDGMYYYYNTLSRVIGKSMVFSVGFNDNWVAGKTLKSTINENDIQYNNGAMNYNDNDDYGGLPLDALKYCDENGEFDKIYYKFSNKEQIADGVTEEDLNGNMTQDRRDKTISFMLTTWRKPLAPQELIDEYVQFSDNMLVYKDNKEIPTINTQFEFLSATNDILVTEQFVNLQKWVANYDTAKPYSIYEAPVTSWNLRSNQLPSGATQLVGARLQIDYGTNNRAKITLNDTLNSKAYYVVVDNKVALAFKGQNGDTDIWLNVLSNRDTNIYNAQGIITGEI